MVTQLLLVIARVIFGLLVTWLQRTHLAILPAYIGFARDEVLKAPFPVHEIAFLPRSVSPRRPP